MEKVEEFNPAVLRAAAEWFALLGADASNAEARSRWQAWLDADASHRAAWARVEAISRHFDLPRDARTAVDKALDTSSQHVLRRRRFVKTLLGVGGVGVIGWGIDRTQSLQHVVAGLRADHLTAVGETREIDLPGGSHVWMNTATALDVSGSVARFRFGELFVETDVSGTATLAVADATLHAQRGARFNVRHIEREPARLDVYAGQVEVRLRVEAPRLIAAGQQVELTSSGLAQPREASLAREAWIRGILLAENVALFAFLDEVARYRRGLLFCDPGVAALRVVGGFPLHDSNRVLRMLEAALPVRVTRRSQWWVSVDPR